MSSRSKTNIILTAAAIAVTIFGIVWTMRAKTPALTADPSRVIAFVSSKGFTDLKADEKYPYAEKYRELYYKRPDLFTRFTAVQLAETDRTVEEVLMDRRVQQYLALTSTDERNKFLDQQIQELENRAQLEMARIASAPTAQPVPADVTAVEPQDGSDHAKTPLESYDGAKLGAYLKYMQDLSRRIETRAK